MKDYWILIFIAIVFASVLGLVTLSLIKEINRSVEIQNMKVDFCEDQGYTYGNSVCYTSQGDYVITKEMIYLDGKVYWVEEGK